MVLDRGNPGASVDPGWWVDDVKVDGTTIPDGDGTSFASWQSPTQVSPIPVNGFTVQLVAYKLDGTVAWIYRLALDSNFDGTLGATALASLQATGADVVAALVMYDELTELITDYAPYTLTVNGVTQPGGS